MTQVRPLTAFALVRGLSCLKELVGDRGFEPLTSSVSRKRSPPELIARLGADGSVPTSGVVRQACGMSGSGGGQIW
jgi:hypothetical protein